MNSERPLSQPVDPTNIPTITIPLPVLILFIGALGLSTASIFTRFAQDTGSPSVLIAFGRLLVASIFMSSIVVTRHLDEFKKITRQQVWRAAVAGFFHALLFLSWIVSLEYTSVAISVTLVSTSPIWVFIFSVIFRQLKLSASTLMLVTGTVVGAAFMAAAPTAFSSEVAFSPIGPVLALIGAAAYGAYLFVSKSGQTGLSLQIYVWLVYSFACAFTSLFLLSVNWVESDISIQSIIWILLIGLIPQLGSQTALNYATRYMSATYVSIVVLCEPIGSTTLAYFLFDEVPTSLQIIGAVLILSCLFAASRYEADNRTSKLKK